MGSGKTTYCKQWEEKGVPVFYCDAEARQLMLCDGALRAEIEVLVGSMEKDALRAYIGRGREYADRVNALVWPRVMQLWQNFCKRHEEAGVDKVMMECALLYESGFDSEVDEMVVITAPLEERVRRVMKRDGITEERARQIMALQMTDEERKNYGSKNR